jgi:hypothetical protein
MRCDYNLVILSLHYSERANCNKLHLPRVFQLRDHSATFERTYQGYEQAMREAGLVPHSERLMPSSIERWATCRPWRYSTEVSR